MPKKNFYAVLNGRVPGIYQSWSECQKQIDQFPKSKYKSFFTLIEAEEYMKGNDSKDANTSLTSCNLSKQNFYVVINGHVPGIYPTWNECKKQIDKYPKNKFKSFSTLAEADAYIQENKAETKIVPVKTTVKRKINELPNSTDNKENKLPRMMPVVGQPIVNSRVGGADQMHCGRMTQASKNNHTLPDNITFDQDDPSRVVVYTDGSCMRTKKGFISGFGVYWGPNCSLNTSLPYEGVQTNNRAEIAAVIHVVRTARALDIRKLLVYTDSQFMINCMTKWIGMWKNNKWKLKSNGEPVECRDVLEPLDDLIRSSGINVKWRHVRAHCGNHGNEAADKLAKAGAKRWKTNR